MKIYNNISELVGNTPLVRLNSLEPAGNLLAKLEYLNPAGSAKDRIAKNMLDSADVKPDSTIIEPTSGNTGIGLAAIAASRGYKVILTMPDTMSVERIKLLSAYGAKIVLTEGKLGMQGAIDKAIEIAKSTPDSFIPSQFENPANPEAHYLTTGPEIWQATEGKLDVFVAGVGTGGTLSGVGKYLKEQNPDIEIVAVEPFDSPLISEGKSGPHKLQGIGANFIPKTFDKSVCDKVVTVTTEQAYSAARALAKKEGYLVGISSGAALFAAREIAKTGKTVIALLADTGDRYLSTELFD